MALPAANRTFASIYFPPVKATQASTSAVTAEFSRNAAHFSTLEGELRSFFGMRHPVRPSPNHRIES